MKALPLILVPFLLFQIFVTPNKKTESTFYYFCDSHSMDPQTVIGRQVILYTKVYKIIGEKNTIKERTKEWLKLVENNCENEKGCTSDLNYYPTKEDAEKQFESTKHLYRDASKYILKLIDFK
jgi:hypothetical protein